MTDFRVGDKIRIKKDVPNDCGGTQPGEEYRVESGDWVLRIKGPRSFCSCKNRWELVTPITDSVKAMQIIKLTDAQKEGANPEDKILLEAGVISDDRLLTSSGKEDFIAWLLKDSKKEFSAYMGKKLKEAKKCEKTGDEE